MLDKETEKQSKIKKTKKAYPSYTFNPSIAIMHGVFVGDRPNNSKVKSKKQKEDEKLELLKEKEVTITNKETGEQNDAVILIKTEAGDLKESTPIPIHDTLPYKKLFDELDLSTLSMSAIKVLQYIRENLKPKQHVISIVPKLCMDKYKWGSKTNYYNAIANLLENEILFIKTGVENEYFLNVNKIYNGDRTTHYRTNILNGNSVLKESIRLSKEQYLSTKKDEEDKATTY